MNFYYSGLEVGFSFQWKQQSQFGHSYGTSITNPDFVKLAEAFGAVGLRAESTADIPEMMKKAFACDGPVVMEVPIDYSENLKLTEKLGKLVCPI